MDSRWTYPRALRRSAISRRAIVWPAILGLFLAGTGQAARGDEPAVLSTEFPEVLVKFKPYELNPVFKAEGPGHWDVKIRERGWILREADTYHLWFTGYDGTPQGQKLLGHATSPDGLRWTRDTANPVYNQHWVEDMMVERSGGRWLMFAEGERDRAHLLISFDGRSWRREGQLDIRNSDGQAISEGPFGTPTVWREGDTWFLFYERFDQGVWLAKSTDLKVWTNVQDEPVLSPGPADYDSLLIALNQIVKHDGRYYAYYHGSGTKERPRLWTTNVAASDDLIHWTKYEHNPLVADNQSSGIIIPDGNAYRLYTMHDEVRVYLPVREAGDPPADAN